MADAVHVLCSAATAPGFRLAGLTPIEAADHADGARLLLETLHRPGVGVVLVEEPIYTTLPDVTRRALSRHSVPMVVPFPGPVWTAPPREPESFISDLLRQAIGYRVKLG